MLDHALSLPLMRGNMILDLIDPANPDSPDSIRPIQFEPWRLVMIRNAALLGAAISPDPNAAAFCSAILPPDCLDSAKQRLTRMFGSNDYCCCIELPSMAATIAQAYRVSLIIPGLVSICSLAASTPTSPTILSPGQCRDVQLCIKSLVEVWSGCGYNRSNFSFPAFTAFSGLCSFADSGGYFLRAQPGE